MSLLTSLARIWLTRSFHPFVFTNELDEHLPYENASGLGLYIHIPFCRSLCAFCPYCKVKYDPTQAQAYVEALKREIEIVGSRGGRRNVTTLYFGGGSPALLAKEIGGIVDMVNRYFDIEEGIGIELHPADVTVEKLRILKDAGVTRISIGIQSFDEDTLQILGRGGCYPAALSDALKQVHFETVAMDFIFALPGQTVESLIQDIENAFSIGANHVALYPFIDFTYTKREFPKMPESQKRKLFDGITEHCRRQGYVRDSIWTYAKPGTKKYSSMTRDNFLGFGCSSTSLLNDRFTINTFSIPDYIMRVKEGRLPTSLTLHFTERQRMLYYLFWTAYTTVIDEDAFKDFFGKSIGDFYHIELLACRLLGLVKKHGTQYRMTQRGAYYYHRYENYYTLAYIDQMWDLMKNEAFPERLVIR
ncbi:MAG: coproporphyrinogen III oxidase family protein [Opitutales bacterium]|nr:coproporphyrinogen III oxidase family protein [Opitutales bacterium]